MIEYVINISSQAKQVNDTFICDEYSNKSYSKLGHIQPLPCYTEIDKEKYINLPFIKKYILVFFKPHSAETSSSTATKTRPEPATMLY